MGVKAGPKVYGFKVIDFEPVSFKKELLLICSLGLNIGFIVGIILV